jgi:hypothetical protein
MSTPINAASTPTAGLSRVSDTRSLNQAVGLPLDAARRALRFNGSLNYKVDTAGISKQNLAKAISVAVQSGKVDLNVSPAVFNARTGSQVGSEVEAIAKGLNVKTDRKSVKQLIAEIGDKTAGSKSGQVNLPDKVLNGLGAVSFAALVSEGEGKLNALGIKTTLAFQGGELRVAFLGGDKTGEKIEFAGKITAASGDTTGSVEGRVNSQGGVATKVSGETIGNNIRAKVEASASSIQGEPLTKFTAEVGAVFGNLLLKADASISNTGKGANVGYGASASMGPFSAGVNVTPGDTRYEVNYKF